MSSHVDRVAPPPSREEVAQKLRDLLEGRCTREDAASWAQRWVIADQPEIQDHVLWEAITSLAAADLISTDRPYLYGPDDFRAWLEQLMKG